MTSVRWAERRPGVMSDDLPDGTHGIVAVLLAAVFRGALAALAAFLLSGGLALLMWAVTPDSEPSAVPLLHGSVVAVAAANLMPVSIGGVAVTLPPLLLSIILVLLLAGTASRGRLAPTGRVQELSAALVTAVAYGALVDLVIDRFAPSGAVQLTAAPAGLALVAMAFGVASHHTAWQGWWQGAAPDWARGGLRSAAAAGCVLLAGGAVAVAAGLMLSFSDAVAVGRLTGPGVGDGFGLLLLCLAFLPNAVVAGVGYASGVGFTLGDGTYSVLGSGPVELPAIPLLAAAPANPGLSQLGLALMIFPVAAAVVIGIVVVRTVGARLRRLAAATLGSVLTGALVSGLAAVAGGGVERGPWAVGGVPVLPAGLATAAALALVSLVWAAVAGWGAVPWRATVRAGERDDVDDAEAASGGRWTSRVPLRGLATRLSRALVNRRRAEDEAPEGDSAASSGPAEVTAVAVAGEDDAGHDETVEDGLTGDGAVNSLTRDGADKGLTGDGADKGLTGDGADGNHLDADETGGNCGLPTDDAWPTAVAGADPTQMFPEPVPASGDESSSPGDEDGLGAAG